MKTIFKIEAINDDFYQLVKLRKREVINHFGENVSDGLFGYIPAPYWVARITGTDPKYKYNRLFIKGRKDYSKSNSIGSRGIFIYYELDDGIYEIKERIAWTKSDRYFIKVVSGGYKRIPEKEVQKCLK